MSESLKLGKMFRAGMERVIDETAPRLAATSSDIDRRRLLEAALRRLRRMIKREFPRAFRRIRAAGERRKVGAGE